MAENRNEEFDERLAGLERNVSKLAKMFLEMNASLNSLKIYLAENKIMDGPNFTAWNEKAVAETMETMKRENPELFAEFEWFDDSENEPRQ